MYRHSFIFALIFAAALASIVLVVSAQSSKVMEWIASAVAVIVILMITTGRTVSLWKAKSHAASAVKAAEQEEAPDEDPEESDLRGVWSGTATVWPVRRSKTLVLHPLRLLFSGDPLEVEVLPVESSAGEWEPAEVELLEHDASRGNIDLRIVVTQKRCRRAYTVRLMSRSDGLVSEDDSDPCTVELIRDQSDLKADGGDVDDELADVGGLSTWMLQPIRHG